MLERILTPHVVDQYLERLRAHVSLWQGAAQRVHASWSQVSAEFQLDVLARKELHQLVEVA